MVPPIKLTTTVENLPWVHTPADTSLIPGTTARRCVPEQWTLTMNGQQIARIIKHFQPDIRDFTLESALLDPSNNWPYGRTREHGTLEEAQSQMVWLLSRQAANEAKRWALTVTAGEEVN